jgi:hypothetical protein
MTATRRNEPVICKNCGRRVARQSRQQNYCSRRCRQRTHYAKSVAEGRFDPLLGHHSGLPTNPLGKLSTINSLAQEKSGSTPSICGPAVTIRIEIVARWHWVPIVSPDGVRVEVARLSSLRGAR